MIQSDKIWYTCSILQDPSLQVQPQQVSTGSEATEWDDVLVKFGIKKPTNNEEERVIEETFDDMFLEEDDEEVFKKFRSQRLAEFEALRLKATFGEVEEITGQDFVEKVNKAGPDIWVVLHLYKPG